MADEPFSNGGPIADRGTDGRFTRGNRAALVVGERSAQFWHEQASARHELTAALAADAGHSLEDVPRAFTLAADGLAQAVLVRDSAFAKLVEQAGPLTTGGRVRRAYIVWLSASDRVERGLRLVGLGRQPRDIGNMSAAEWLAMTTPETADQGGQAPPGGSEHE